MRLTICHLSDIHFEGTEDAVLEKKEMICDVILQDALKKDVIFFIISGDIAQSGQKEQYLIALDFFTDIQSKLKDSKSISSYFFFSPGNHDCDFTDKQRNKDDDLRREKIFSAKEGISEEDLAYYIQSLCEKQQNFYDFVDLFEYNILDDVIIKLTYNSSLLRKYQIIYCGTKITINCLNSAWLTEIHEKPGNLFFPTKELNNIIKDAELVITTYHHPSNWMHPNDKNIFNRWVMNKSDLVYVGHEHVGRNEQVETRETIYHAQYGEVLQDRNNPDISGLILNYIENNNNSAKVYQWDKDKKIYTLAYCMDKKIDLDGNKYLCYCEEFQNYLETADIRITHPNKENVNMRDLYVYPDVEAYKDNPNVYEAKRDSVTIKGEEILEFILKNKRISFSGKSKSGKTALAKNIALDFIDRGKYCLLIDCSTFNKYSTDFLKKCEEINISKIFGKEYIERYKQLELSNKVLILDNFEKIRDTNAKNEILTFFDNFYDYILTFSNTFYELELLEQSLQKKEKSDYTHCSINELGNRKRNQLISKWYYLNEGGDIIIDEEVKKKIEEATKTINVLKGNGYMPCIPSYILIILQQIEYSMDSGNQERSNYGYLYEFLVNKSILDMDQNCKYVYKDIAFGILTNIAEYMLKNNQKIISIRTFNDIVTKYNQKYQTEALDEMYMDEYSKVELLSVKDNQVMFGYPYIHYYFTAKYLANNIYDEWSRNKIFEMSKQLYDEECGDIMIFLCHLSKDDYIISTVLKNAKNVLIDKEVFDFAKHKSINLSFDSYLEMDFEPEKDEEKRKDELLERQDELEREDRKNKKPSSDSELTVQERENIYNLDNAFKTIEVMGQILKNYPGTIIASTKNELLEAAYGLGMRTLTYTSEILYGGIEKVFEEVRKKLQPRPTPIELGKMADVSRKLNNVMDNIFALLSYATIRKLAESLANRALDPLVTRSTLNGEVAYNLIKSSIQLNEFGVIAVDIIISEYDGYMENDNIFAAKLLRLLVFDHYYVYGSKDFRGRQRIWDKMKFGKKEQILSLQSNN